MEKRTARPHSRPLLPGPSAARVLSLALLSLMMFWVSVALAAESIHYAHQDRVADAATVIAFKKGYFREQGLNLSPRIFASSPRCAEALASDRAVFATLDDTAAAIAIANQPGAFVIVCAHGGGQHRHRIVASARSGIYGQTDLPGKRIGVEKWTAAHSGLMLFARIHGMDLAPNLVDLAVSQQLIALAAGQIDALVASEPTPSQAEAGGYGKQVASLGQLGSTYPMVTAVNARFARRHPKAVVRVIRALIRATLFIKARPGEAAAILARISRLPARTLSRTMAAHYYRVELSPEIRSSLQETARFLLEAGRIDKRPDLDRALDGSYLKKALDNRG